MSDLKAKDLAVRRTLEAMGKTAPPILPGPSPQAAPVQSNPIQQTQKTQPKKVEPNVEPKISEDQAFMEDMLDVENKQKKAIERSKVSKNEEEGGAKPKY